MTDSVLDSVAVTLPRDVAGALLALRTNPDDGWADALRSALENPTIRPEVSVTSVESVTQRAAQERKYVAKFLGVVVTARTLPDVFAQIVDLTADVAPEALDKLATLQTRARRYVAPRPEMVHVVRRGLPTMCTKSGWWISKNIGKEDLKRGLLALARAADLNYGDDIALL